MRCFRPIFAARPAMAAPMSERGYGQWGSGMIDDLEDGVDWLVQQGIVDPHRVCIMGASYGGYAALWAPIRHPERYRCAISFAGVTDVRAMLRYDARRFTAPRYSREWRRRVEGEERIDCPSISPLRQAAGSAGARSSRAWRARSDVAGCTVAQSVRALDPRPGPYRNPSSIRRGGHGFTKPRGSVGLPAPGRGLPRRPQSGRCAAPAAAPAPLIEHRTGFPFSRRAG